MVIEGDLVGAVDVMLAANDMLRRPRSANTSAGFDRAIFDQRARDLARWHPRSLVRSTVATGLIGLMRGASGGNAEVPAEQALTLSHYADRLELEELLGGLDRTARFLTALDRLRVPPN